MGSRLNPYIGFNGNARQALEFYQQVFGGELVVTTFGEGGGMAGTPDADKVMHGQLENPDGYTLMAADPPPGETADQGGNITVCLSGDDGDTLRRYWERLAADGTVSVPLEKQVWGDEYGACTDKFGVNWMVNIGQSGS